MALRTTETVAGVTAIETSAAGATVRMEVSVTVPEVAVIVTLPVAKPVAMPVLVIEAPAVADQATAVVISCVVESLKVPITVNAFVSPFAMVAVEGETAKDIRRPVATVKSAVPEIEPRVAVTVLAPITLAVATPAAVMVAPEVVLQVTLEVTF